MVKRLLAGSAILFVLGAVCVSAQRPAAPAQSSGSVQPEDDDSRFDLAEESRMIAWVNDERRKAGLAAYKPDHLLTLSARKHLLRMLRTQELSHEFNDELPLMDRVAEQGMHFSATAENLAMATRADDMHSGLMNSPGHRANILSPDYDSIGVAVVKNGNEYWSTQHFARATPQLAAADAEATFIQFVQQKRKSSRLPRLKVESNERVRAAVCKMAQADQLKVHDLPDEERLDQWSDGIIRYQRGAYAFTSLDLKDWPENLRGILTNPSLERMYVGACFVSTRKLPGGAYWFGVLF